MNLYELKERIARSGLPVVRTRDIARLAGLKYKEAIVYTNRMVRKGLLKKIMKGYYTIDDDPLLFGTYLTPNSYVSFNTALYLHKLINQIPATIHVVTPAQPRRKIDGITLTRLPKNKIFGYAKMQYHGHPIYVAEKEKALADLLYKEKTISPDLIKKINKKKLEQYAKKMSKTAVKRLEKILETTP